MGIKTVLRRQARSWTGWDIHPYGWRPRRLAGRYNPATIIDVGVASGTPELYAAFPNAFLLLVDPGL
jgi:hypothetical protein